MTAAITLNFRKPELTIGCVESLLADGWGPILIWDNSEDGGVSAAVIRGAFLGVANVHLVESESNLGFAAGVNRALGWLRSLVVSGPVLLINNDAMVLPGLREALLAASEVSPAPTLLAPKILQSGRMQGWMYYQPWLGLVLDRPVWGAVQYLSGCCLLVNRSHGGIPLFDESFFMYGEDVELSRRVVNDGGHLCLVGEVCVTHVGSASTGQASLFYERNMVRAHWMLASKLARNSSVKLMMKIIRVPFLLGRGVLRSVRYGTLNPARALAEIFDR